MKLILIRTNVPSKSIFWDEDYNSKIQIDRSLQGPLGCVINHVISLNEPLLSKTLIFHIICKLKQNIFVDAKNMFIFIYKSVCF